MRRLWVLVTVWMIACSGSDGASKKDASENGQDGANTTSSEGDDAGANGGEDPATGAANAGENANGATGPGDGANGDTGSAGDGGTTGGAADGSGTTGGGTPPPAGDPKNDADVPYTGKYGQPISIRLPYREKEWKIGADGVISYAKQSDAPQKFIIEFVRTTMTVNSNAQYDKRVEGTVYLRDVFHLRQFGSTAYVFFDGEARRFKVGMTDKPAEFMLINKYGGNVDKVDTDAYCKGVYDSFEYYEDPNNRNVTCEFPYTDCYGRCAFRKLLFVQGTAEKMVGLSTKAPTDHVTIDGITGYENYEHLLP